MSTERRIALIGEVIIDVSHLLPHEETKMRLGGIIHAARALWGIGREYDLFFISPDYLVDQITDYAKEIGACKIEQIGKVLGAPNVILIGKPTEAGDQSYELILREEYKCNFLLKGLQNTDKDTETDAIVYSGNYKLSELLKVLEGKFQRLHIDLGNGIEDLSSLNDFGKALTIFVATSSKLFLNFADGKIETLKNHLLPIKCNTLVLKENRGGARLFSEIKPKELRIGAQIRKIVHSVGVGDCFDASFVAKSQKYPLESALAYSSWIASEYARTTYPEDFREACKKLQKMRPEKISQIAGISLPWEYRPNIHLYIAAPDFDYIDVSLIDALEKSLKYHNFRPHRPVKENGQMGLDADQRRKQELFNKDLSLLDRCQIVVAVLLNNDPGTLIEVGIAARMRKPILLFDPYKIAENLILTEVSTIVTDNLDDIVDQVFVESAKVINNEN